MTIRVIDLETTGDDPATDQICEMASVDIKRTEDGAYFLANMLSTLVKPTIPIKAVASAVHHIIDADVENAPEMSRAITPFVMADDALIYVAHNAQFEQGFLRDWLEIVPGHKWVCTYKCALRVWPELPKHTNQFLRYHLGFIEPFGMKRGHVEAHRALSDCYVTGCIFLALLKRATFAQLLAWTLEPPLHTIITFGKMHKGQRYDTAPDDYLRWVIEKSDLNAETKFSAQYWLNQKAAA